MTNKAIERTASCKRLPDDYFLMYGGMTADEWRRIGWPEVAAVMDRALQELRS